MSQTLCMVPRQMYAKVENMLKDSQQFVYKHQGPSFVYRVCEENYRIALLPTWGDIYR